MTQKAASVSFFMDSISFNRRMPHRWQAFQWLALPIHVVIFESARVLL
jgi:hypothetical protein